MKNEKKYYETLLGATKIEFEVEWDEKPFEYHKHTKNQNTSISSDGGIEDWGNAILEG